MAAVLKKSGSGAEFLHENQLSTAIGFGPWISFEFVQRIDL
jgi:hypothetical protein